MKKHFNLILILTILTALGLNLMAAGNAIDFEIVRPQYNETLKTEKMSLKVSFTSNTGEKITRFSLLLDDKRFINGTINNPIEKGSFELNECDFSSLKIEPGKHILTVQLFDAKDNKSEKLQIVNFLPTETTPPVVTIVEPSAGTKVNGQVQVRVVSIDDSGIDVIEIYVDNNLRALSSESDFAFNWDPIKEGITQGSHTIHAIATDIYGNIAYSNYVMVLVENPYLPESGKNPTAWQPTVTTQYLTDIANLASIARANTPLTARVSSQLTPNSLNTYGTKLSMLNKSYQRATAVATIKNNEFKIVPPVSANKISALRTKNIKTDGYLPIITIVDNVGTFKQINPDADSIRRYYTNEVLPLLSIDSKVVVPTSVTVSYNNNVSAEKPNVAVTSYITPTTTIAEPKISQSTLPIKDISVVATVNTADVTPTPAHVVGGVIKGAPNDTPNLIPPEHGVITIAQIPAGKENIGGAVTETTAPAINVTSETPQIIMEGSKGNIEGKIATYEVKQIAQAEIGIDSTTETKVGLEVMAGEPIVCGPAPLTPNITLHFQRTHTVKSGDTLNKIASKYDTTVEKLKKENPGINPNLIKVGQEIYIPMKKGVSAYLNDEKLDSELTSEGFYLVSLRSFVDANGEGVLIWLPKTREVEAYINNHKLKVKIGEKEITVDEKMLVMPVESVLKQGRTYVAAALFRDGLGYSAELDEKGLILSK